MAATYPLEVVQAERWLAENKGLKDDALRAALAKQSWDDSVKSLIATPSVIAMMSKKLDWTQKLGDAVLAQETEVMDAVQRLRLRAQGTDKLKSNKEQNVTVRQGGGGKQVIAIEPANPDVVYVPYYDPAVVYGAWPYPEYPPDYYYPDDYWLPGGIIATGIAFGSAYALWRWASGNNWWWGGNINWNNRNIDIKRGDHVAHWRHDATHRRGVAYNNPKVRQQFAGAGNRPQQRPGGGAKAGDRGKQAGGPKGGGKQAGKGGGAKQAGKGGGAKQAGKAKAGGKQAAKGKGAAQGKRTAHNKGAQGKRTAQQRARAPQQRARAPQQRSRNVARVQRQSFGPRGGGRSYGRSFGGGGRSFGGGGRSFGGGGRGFGGGGRGGGRRSDIRVKHDIALLGHLDNGLGWYRFAYTGGTKMYVGVMAQEVQKIAPSAVMRGPDGTLSVDYERLGLKFQSYNEWIASGGKIPGEARVLPAAR
jgi:hypothetical protein